MDIISIFESALEEKNWEKLFRARSMMQAFWYNKWERFEGAIGRALSSLTEEKARSNFFPVEKITSWWRPGKDFLITRWGCYILLKFCDGRKQEVQDLKAYLEKLYLNSKIQTQKIGEKPKTKKVFFSGEFFLLIAVFFFALFTLMYYANFFSFLESREKQFYIPQKFIPPAEVQVFEEKYVEEDKHTLLTPEVQKQLTFQEKLQDYIQKWWGNLLNLDPKVNPRTLFTRDLSWSDLILAFFELGNNWFFDESCALLERKDCNALSKNLTSFANFWKKTRAWYEVVSITQPEKSKYCVQYKYSLKNDRTDDFIIETFQYQTSFRNGVEEITGRFCEKIQKNGRNIACPFVLKNYVCK